MRVLKRLPLLCIALAACGAAAFVSSEAEAAGCNDHFFNKMYSSRARANEIPKTRRVSSRKKKVAPAAIARPAPKPAVAEPVLRVLAVERSHEPSALEELVLTWLAFESVTGDQREKAMPRLLYNRIPLGLAIAGDASPIVADVFVARPLFHTPLPLRI